ncbi:MAG: pyridoxal-phosphate dependent enzyme, partial [Terriglobales bacterium]
AINLEHIRAYVDDIVRVTEDEIREAMHRLSANPKTVAEPSGAVAPAAFLFHTAELPPTTIDVAVISGGNIDPKLLAELQRR